MLAIALSVLVLLPGAADAASIRLAADSVQGDGWSVRSLEVRADLDSGHLESSAAAIDAGAVVGVLEDVRLTCRIFLQAQGSGCGGGSLEARHPWLRGPVSGIRATLLPAGEGLSIDVAEARTLFGRLQLALTLGPDSVQAQLRGSQLDAAGLVRLGSTLWPAGEGIEAQGQLGLDATLEAAGDSQHRVEGRVGFTGIRFGDDTGLLEAENLAGELTGSWQVTAGSGSRFDLTGRLLEGAAYLDPVYVEVTPGNPWQWRSSGRLAEGRLTLSSASIEVGSALKLTAVGTVPLSAPAQSTLRLDASSADLASAFGTFGKPFLTATALADISLEGRGDATVALERGRPTALRALLQDLRLDDPRGRLALEGLDADVQWADSGGPWPASLAWRGGAFYRLPFGPSRLALEVTPAILTLQRMEPLPLLGGQIVTEALRAEDTPTGLNWELAGRVTGVDLGEFTKRLDWPALNGDLSGIIPSARYTRQRFQVGGAILVRVFDGSITITDLVLNRPLGPIPTLTANLDLAHIDLERLTHAFSLGRIEGRLEGYVRDLELVRWQPTQFDAYLGTPEGDDSRHRISQRAVNEIASLGSVGAPVAALSRGVLSLFSEFSYRRLGVSCRLRGDVCEMGGIAPAADGYYLVQGSGLPQINVIGYARRVDWEDLVARLVAATKSEGPVIGPEGSQ